MKALLLSTSLAGGAGGAARRLWRGLAEQDVTTRLLVAREEAGDPEDVLAHGRHGKLDRVRRRLDRRPLRRYNDPGPGQFSVQWVPSNVHRRVASIDTDIVNLHWVCGAFVPIESVARIAKPLVWTMHDMWPFTGGCHYSGACDRYTDRCGTCPELQSQDDDDLSRRIWSRKSRAWRDLDLTLVTPSRWLAGCARRSSLFRDRRVEAIPLGIDTQTFRPQPQAAARQTLGLPADRRIVMTGAWGDIKRKGSARLADELRILQRTRGGDDLLLVTFGATAMADNMGGIAQHALGRLHTPAQLATAYAAADVFVLPSLMDNLPTTVIEAQACGTPCVGFRTGGVPELIEHESTGFVAELGEDGSLAGGIAWVLADDARRAALGTRARARAEREFAAAVEATRYRDLFAEVLAGSGGG